MTEGLLDRLCDDTRTPAERCLRELVEVATASKLVQKADAAIMLLTDTDVASEPDRSEMLVNWKICLEKSQRCRFDALRALDKKLDIIFQQNSPEGGE